MKQTLDPARQPDESFEEYNQRRKLMNAWTKRVMTPVLVWNANQQGTYRNQLTPRPGKA